MYFYKNQREIISKMFFCLLIIVCLVNLFYLPDYFTDRFFTSGMIWIGISVPIFFLLFLFIKRGEIRFPVIVLYIGGLIVLSGCYAALVGTFSLQQMTFMFSLFLLMLMLANSDDHWEWRVAFGVLTVVACIEALMGIAQYFDWCVVYDFRFPVTGTFENPAGFATFLAMCFPFALSFIFTKSIYLRWWGGIVSALSVVAILLSGSRTGLMAIFVVTAIVISHYLNIHYKIGRWLWFGGVCIGIVLFVGLYLLKKDSADGRILIWRCTAQMIAEKPFLGHGPGSFGGEYMEYQARFLSENPDPRLEQLADNVKHPFNEYLKIGAEYGLISLALILGGMIGVFRLIKNRRKEQYPLFLSLMALAVCGLFSYPLNYPSICVLLFIVLGLILRNELALWSVGRVVKWGLGGITVGLLCFTVYWKQMETCWSDVAFQALSGKEKVIEQYRKLYPFLRENPLFLYNYGAELNVRKQWEESNRILSEGIVLLNDTDVQILLADNYINLLEYNQAELHLQLSAQMCPNRFIPLYQLMKLYMLANRHFEAQQMARQIIDKPQKVPSYTIDKIKQEMEVYIKEGILE